MSPIKKTEQDGFDLGEDNRIESIYIKDNVLRFKISSILRPGRFLGNHCLAFTIPNRTFIITMDRIREGISNARLNKRAIEARQRYKEVKENQVLDHDISQAMSQSSSTSSNIMQDIDLPYKKELDKDDIKFIDPTSNNSIPIILIR